jgi:hypothetical protein
MRFIWRLCFYYGFLIGYKDRLKLVAVSRIYREISLLRDRNCQKGSDGKKVVTIGRQARSGPY